MKKIDKNLKFFRNVNCCEATLWRDQSYAHTHAHTGAHIHTQVCQTDRFQILLTRSCMDISASYLMRVRTIGREALLAAIIKGVSPD